MALQIICYISAYFNVFVVKKIFSKSNFPKAPGGNRYEWESAETIFKILKEGLFVVKIVASTKNAKQNYSTDDDDLRIALDGFHFGKGEELGIISNFEILIHVKDIF